VPGVIATQVDFERGAVRIRYDADRVQVGQLADQLEHAGYRALGLPRFIETGSTAPADGDQE